MATAAARSATGVSAGHPLRQRALIVLPSTGEFDSRTYRIARTLVERGHEVTVLARWSDGLPFDERHPLGYRILRVRAAAIDGLPFPGLVRPLGAIARRLYALRTGASVRPLRSQDLGAGPLGAVGAAAEDGGRASLPWADPASGRASRARRVFSGVACRLVTAPRRAFYWLIRRLAIPLKIRAFERGARLVAPSADLYHGMAYMAIPIALALARRTDGRVIYDARDIYLEARNLARLRGPARWLIARGERSWARRADRVITVNDAYADVLAARFGIARPLVVMNCSFRYDPPWPRPRRFHERLGLPPDQQILLYHGGFFPERGLEQLLAAVPRLPDMAEVVLMGYGVLEAELRRRANEPPLAGRVHVLPAVQPEVLHDWVASADVVAMLIQPSTLNHRLTTPNKLFEAMAAGVPVVASDLPGMAGIVRETGCGLLVAPDDPIGAAEAISSLLELEEADRRAWRDRAVAAAQTIYNWERQADVLLAEYTRLSGRPW